MGNLSCSREHSVQFFVNFFFTQLSYTVDLGVYEAFRVVLQTLYSSHYSTLFRFISVT
jgi:hypothetical protein